ncbi:MAG: hypothetical protein J5854_06355 [Clostridia bacterium]|nr:hypothetical protein [Clostridia bacterium]
MKKLIAIILISVLTIPAAGCRYLDLTDYLASITYTEAPVISTEAPTPEPTATPEPTVEPTLDPFPGLPDEYRDLSDNTKTAVMKAKIIMGRIIDYITGAPIHDGSTAQPFVGQNRYRELDQEELSIYQTLLACAAGFTDYSFACQSGETVDRVMTALFIDHPEIEIYFDVEKTEGEGDEMYRTVFFLPEGRYFDAAADRDEIKEQVETFNAVAAYVVGLIPDDFSTIDKYRAIAYYITANSQYPRIENEETPRYAINAYGAIVNGYSICQGYTIGFEYLCRLANLSCRRVRNEYNDENMHFWDEVTLLGGTYYVDVTWADGSATDYRDVDWFRWFMFIADNYHVSDDGTTTTGPDLNKTGWAG